MRDFDSVAAGWDNQPRRVILARAVADGIIDSIKPSGIRALDFGCGTGLVTLALAPFCSEIVAADSSSGMLEQLTKKLAEAEISNVSPLFIQQDKEDALPSGFDLVVSSMTMHHIADVQSQLIQFRKILNPGGFLCIADLESEDGTFHDNPEGIQHHGFTKEQMESFFSAAGFTDIVTKQVAAVKKERKDSASEYPVNLTTGRANY